MADLKLIVGLGNPGREYEYTRHNLGFLVLDFLAKQHNLKFLKSSLMNGMVSVGTVHGHKVMLLMPWTYMNHSGGAVQRAVAGRNISLTDLLVVCDDLNIEYGHMRLRTQGSDGGHNGLTSIIEYLKTKNFPRLRLGIGSPRSKENTVDFVLSEFSSNEKESLNSFIQQATECCVAWLTVRIEKAMRQFNKRIEDE